MSANGSMKTKPLCLPVLPLALLLFLPLILHFPRTSLPDCQHALIITQARHGSTWLLDSIEHCRYSSDEQVEPGVYGKRVFLDTELWHIHNSSLRDITVPRVLDYLKHNSIKLFPTGFKDIRRIERLLSRLHTPVVVLRRIPKDSCCSMERARNSGEWARVKGQTSVVTNSTCPCDEKCQQLCREWATATNNYFADVANFLHRSRVQADWLWYENVKDLPVVTLTNARCVVRNCNFADT